MRRSLPCADLQCVNAGRRDLSRATRLVDEADADAFGHLKLRSPGATVIQREVAMWRGNTHLDPVEVLPVRPQLAQAITWLEDAQTQRSAHQYGHGRGSGPAVVQAQTVAPSVEHEPLARPVVDAYVLDEPREPVIEHPAPVFLQKVESLRKTSRGGVRPELVVGLHADVP